MKPSQLDAVFPRYREFDPKVPVWCLTPHRGGCIHRFFDTSPVSPSGRYVGLFRFPFEDRGPQPGDRGEVLVVDLATGKEHSVAETAGWEAQMGANVNWGADDHALFFNDVDTASWTPFAWKADFLRGTRERMDGTVYHASPDGQWLISSNLRNTARTQPGYGVCVPHELVRRNVGPVEDDGFRLTDTSTGRSRMLVSLADLLTKADPPMLLEHPERYEIYGFHSKFNPQGDRLMVSVRAFPATDEPQWNLFKTDHRAVRFAWITLGLDGGPMHCAVGPEQWEKGGHHGTWFPDGKRISMNLAIDRECLRLVQVNADGSGLRKMHDRVVGSGHPTVLPDGRHVLTDSYAGESVAFGDGTVPLRWIDLETGTEEALVRINVKQPVPIAELRIDPHPAWDRGGRFVTFNGFVGGTRRVFLADMQPAL
jgi:hypothetical protein